jgi:hypothetical protein
MAKQKKAQQKQSVVPVKKAIESSVAAGQEAAVDTSTEAVTDPFMTIEQVAAACVVGFKPHWLVGIMAYAKSEGFREPAPESACKALLQKWGAALK